ncbi:MAG: hypothetical protein OQK09_03620 [Colwellia sp.]|nr:hypothetical protein [Colwellia sp.]MCW8864067.1 hypothetical protein [Colwellia sp.]MCW9080576.1 hypothetical protein [Colwellia sp.]
MRFLNIVLLTVISFSGMANNNDFESVTVGLKISKPSDWQFVSAQENLENLKRVEHGSPEFKKLMLKHTTAPLVAMAKYAEPFDDLNPSIKVNLKPLGSLDGNNPSQILNLILPQFKKSFQGFKLVQKPVETKIAGLKASYMRLNYSLSIPDGRSFPTTSELWIVPRGDFFFMIGSGTRQDEATGTRKEIKEILNTLVLSK